VGVVDRATCERLFGVGRRRAAYLMRNFRGFCSGNTILLDRMQLIQQLRELAAAPDTAIERRRNRRLAKQLAGLHRHWAAAAVRIPVQPDACQRRFPMLARGVALAGGCLTVEFAAAEELLARLYEFLQAVAGDFEEFRRAAEQQAPRA
jgi:hypothetical protein